MSSSSDVKILMLMYTAHHLMTYNNTNITFSLVNRKKKKTEKLKNIYI